MHRISAGRRSYRGSLRCGESADGPNADLLVLAQQTLELLGREPVERAQECPLVRQRFERRRIEKHACPGVAATALQRQRDQVAEALCRHEVLAWEEPVVACEVEFPATGHRGAEQQRSEPASCRGRDRTAKKTQSGRLLPTDSAPTPPAPRTPRMPRAARAHRAARSGHRGRRRGTSSCRPGVAGRRRSTRVRVDGLDCLVVQRQVGLRAVPAPAFRGRWCIAALPVRRLSQRSA